MPFLKSQEKTLKKLTIDGREEDGKLMEFVEGSKELRLEYLNLSDNNFDFRNRRCLNFLGQQKASLKTFILDGPDSFVIL